MAEVQNGTKAVVWGMTTGATGTGMGTFEAQSANFDAEADEVEIRNAKGQVVTDIFYNQRHLLRMEVIPSGTTLALAKAASILPAPGAIITVTDADDTELTATHTALYIFVRGSKAKSNTGETRLTFEMKQYVENNVAVVLV